MKTKPRWVWVVPNDQTIGYLTSDGAVTVLPCEAHLFDDAVQARSAAAGNNGAIMNVILKTDGREFEAFDDYQPGDAAWFGTEVLLIVSVHNGQAEAIVHPEARAMLQAAMSGPRDDGGSGMAEAMRIHGRAGWQRVMAVCPHPEEEVAPLSGDAWMCVGCGQDVVQSTATDAKIDAAIAEADMLAGLPEAERARIIAAGTSAWSAAHQALPGDDEFAKLCRANKAERDTVGREVAAYRARRRESAEKDHSEQEGREDPQ